MKTFRIGVAGGLLFALVTAMAVKAQESRLDKRLDKILAAALHGPELKKFKYIDHEFNIKKVKITDRVAGITKIEGQISHHLLFRPDEQFYYLIEKQNGRFTKAEFRIEADTVSSYKPKLISALPNASITDAQLEDVLSNLAQRRDPSWQCEAECIALAIALRVDPQSHHDRAHLTKQPKPSTQTTLVKDSESSSSNKSLKIARAQK